MATGLQVWSQVPPSSTAAGRTAQRLEAAGWDGIMFPDSQCLAADVVVAMTAAATATTTLGISTGVTNPVTRHPVIVAATAVSLQELSGGRVAIALGRGDSALAHLGLAPAPARILEQSVRVIRAFARGDEVPFTDLDAFQIPGLKHVDVLALGHGIDAPRLAWRNRDVPPPLIDVSASGPRTIAFAAREADGVLFAVGASCERLSWAVDLARANGATRVGAYVNVVAHPDVELATRLARSMVAPFARFSVLDGVVRAPVDAQSRQELASLHGVYDMRGHGTGAAAHAGGLGADFVRTFGIVGPPDHCVNRIREIADLGIGRIIVVGPTAAENRDAVAASRSLFNTEVLPHVASYVSAGGSRMRS